MLPWSVMPMAGWPSAAAAPTTSPIRDAPSSIEYSVWTCRWVNDFATNYSAKRSVRLTPVRIARVKLVLSTLPAPRSRTAARSRDQRHEHLGGGQGAVRTDELALSGQGRIQETDLGASGEQQAGREDVFATPLSLPQWLAGFCTTVFLIAECNTTFYQVLGVRTVGSRM